MQHTAVIPNSTSGGSGMPQVFEHMYGTQGVVLTKDLWAERAVALCQNNPVLLINTLTETLKHTVPKLCVAHAAMLVLHVKYMHRNSRVGQRLLWPHC